MEDDKKKKVANRVGRRDVWFTKEADDILESVTGNTTDFINRAVIGYWHMTEGESIPVMSRESVKYLASEIARQMKKDERPKTRFPEKQYAFNGLRDIEIIALVPKNPEDSEWREKLTIHLKEVLLEPFAVLITANRDRNQALIMIPKAMATFWESIAQKTNSVITRNPADTPTYASYVSEDGRKHTLVEAGNEGGMICWAVFPHLSPLI